MNNSKDFIIPYTLLPQYWMKNELSDGSDNRVDDEERRDEEPREEYVNKDSNKKKSKKDTVEVDREGMGISKKTQRQHSDERDARKDV